MLLRVQGTACVILDPKHTSSTADTIVMMEKIRNAAHMVNRGERPLVDSPVSGLMSDMVVWRELFNFMGRALQLIYALINRALLHLRIRAVGRIFGVQSPQ